MFTIPPIFLLLMCLMTITPAIATDAPYTYSWSKNSTPKSIGIKAVIHLKAKLKTAMDVLWDVKQFDKFMPNAQEATIISQTPTQTVVDITGGKGPIHFTMRLKRTKETNRISWVALDKTIQNNGSWVFTPESNNQLKLDYALKAVPPRYIPLGVVQYMQESGMNHFLEAVAKRIIQMDNQ
jgi:ribosome-associated toxin RatA of RatAB toxin-antitoxin module